MGRHGDDARSDDDPSARIGRWMFAVLFWGLLVIVGSVGIDTWLTSRAAAREPRTVGGGEGIELVADRQGHYVVTGSVDGQQVDFLVDTGASDVAIPAALAAELGLRPGRRTVVQTANGTASARATTIDRLVVGPLERRNVDASIVPGMDGRTALLGMSFLRHHDLLQRDGRLVISVPELR